MRLWVASWRGLLSPNLLDARGAGLALALTFWQWERAVGRVRAVDAVQRCILQLYQEQLKPQVKGTTVPGVREPGLEKELQVPQHPRMVRL